MNKNIFKTLFISLIMFCGVFFINLNDAKADRINQTATTDYFIASQTGGPGYGYAQCAYRWTSGDYQANGHTANYRLILKVWSTNGSMLFLNYQLVSSNYNNATKSTSPDIDRTKWLEHATFHSNEKVINNTYKGKFKCPQVCVDKNISNKVKWETISSDQKVSCSGGFTKIPLSNDYDWTKVSNNRNETTNSDINVEPLSKWVDEHKPADVDENGNVISGDVDIEGILNWGKNNTEGNYTIDEVGSPCGSITDIADMLTTVLWIIDIIGILILIIMTIVNFIQAITGSDEEFRDAFKHLRVRVIVVFVLLLLPIIVGWIITIINESGEGIVRIGEDGQPFCDVGK